MNNTCCVFGHRTINETQDLRTKITDVIEKLIPAENVDTFLSSSKSHFNSLCLELVTKMKVKYPHIKQIYVRAEFPDISDDYKTYLMNFYEDTCYPEKIRRSGRAAYVERNYEMINKSRYCIVYYDEANAPTTRKSGIKVALDYAVKHRRKLYIYP